MAQLHKCQDLPWSPWHGAHPARAPKPSGTAGGCSLVTSGAPSPGGSPVPNGGARAALPIPRASGAAGSSGAGFLWQRLLSCCTGDESGAINTWGIRAARVGVPAAPRGTAAGHGHAVTGEQLPVAQLSGQGQAGTL